MTTRRTPVKEAAFLDLEQHLNMRVGDINRELDKGLAGAAVPWEGAKQFHQRMLKKHQDVSPGGASK